MNTESNYDEMIKKFPPDEEIKWCMKNPKDTTPLQRLMVANYLNSVKYGYFGKEPPRMDKTVFSMVKIIDG